MSRKTRLKINQVQNLFRYSSLQCLFSALMNWLILTGLLEAEQHARIIQEGIKCKKVREQLRSYCLIYILCWQSLMHFRQLYSQLDWVPIAWKCIELAVHTQGNSSVLQIAYARSSLGQKVHFWYLFESILIPNHKSVCRIICTENIYYDK